MDRKIRVAAIGDNCIDYYDSLNESYPGGNPVNVAVYIKRLGGESSYTGAVGTDSFGKIMISAIQNKGVDTSHIQVLDGKTAVTHVDIVDGDRVFGKYEEGVLADFKLREQDISFIKKHDLAVTGIWGMIEDELPLISKEIPVAFDFANKFANPIVEKAIPYVTYAFFSFDEESRNEFRQKYHSMGLKEKENCTEQLKEFMKAMQQKGPKVIIATLGKNGSISMVICSLAGYGFEIYHDKAKDAVMDVILLAMMVPFITTLVPLFQMVAKMKMLNSALGFILPTVSTPFLIMMFRQSARSFPLDIIEAARLDGLSEIRIFFQMFIPTMKSTYAAAMTITFMNAWNSYMWPKVIMTESKSMTMPMVVANLTEGYVTDYGMLMLAVLICTLPTALVFFILQKSFAEGITGAVK